MLLPRIFYILLKGIMLKRIFPRVIIIILLNLQTSCGFVNSPKIVTKDGHLIFYSGLNRNITFQLVGNSRLKINDELDVLNLLGVNANSTSRSISCEENVTLSEFRDELDDFRNKLSGANGLTQKIQALQMGAANVTRLYRDLQTKVLDIESQTRLLNSRANTDQCLSNPCKNGGTCLTLFGKFTCKCRKNFEGKTCEQDVNECALYEGTDLGCQNGGQCVNQFGGFSCLCTTGWYGIHCNKRQNDCSRSSAWELCAHGVCVNTNVNFGYKCICDQGWTTNNLSPACSVDVDECSNGTTPCMTKCINLPGTFTCAPCDKGLTGNGLICRDIDECAVNNGGCSISPMVPCINTYGSYHCGECPFGWSGDGRTCQRSMDINDRTSIATPCKVTSVCHPLASCAEISGTVVCSCPVGMTGNGLGKDGCANIPGIKCDTQPCLNGGTCLDTESGYSCACPRGFQQPNCAPISNVCFPNPCQNGGFCIKTNSISFDCNCLPGFEGHLCEKRLNRCGGVFVSESGKLKYPLNSGYNHYEKCSWKLTTNESMVLNITFNKFELEDSSDCSLNFLQINDGPSAADQIIGRFCGNKKPLGGKIVASTNSLYLWFFSGNLSNEHGFDLEWNSIPPKCGGIVNATSHGTISSPGSPGKYPKNRDCVWQIHAPLSKQIKLTFFSLNLENHTSCEFDFLEIKDTISHHVLGKYCTTSTPTPLLLTTNDVNIRFHSDNENNDFGFQIFYSLEERIPNCGGTFTDKFGTIRSPNTREGETISCEYMIRGYYGQSIKINFLNFDRKEGNCIEINSIDSKQNQTVLESKYCGEYDFYPNPIQTFYSDVLIKYYTNGGGFLLSYERSCQFTYESDTDLIISPTNEQFCTYHIITRPNTVIELDFIEFDMKNNADDTSCTETYLKIKNGLDASSGDVQVYCDANIPTKDFVSNSNYLALTFSSSNSSEEKSVFRIRYATVSMNENECGGVFKTPGHKIRYPSSGDNGYLDNKTCYWVIMAPPNKAISLNWISFDLEEDNECEFDYIEIYENIADLENTQPLARYCGTTIPPIFTSQSRMLTVKFVSDVTDNFDGFEATYDFVDKNACGLILFSSNGEITSPGYPQNYTNNLNCTWLINGPLYTQIELQVKYFDIEDSKNCDKDFLSLRNGGTEKSHLIGNFCGKIIPQSIPSFTHQLLLQFYTDGSYTGRGFRITWKLFSNNCGGILKSEKGIITSPLYPNPYMRNSVCEWHIIVPKGSIIEITIEDIELENSCEFDYLEIIDGPKRSGALLDKLCTSESKKTILTTQNQAFLSFITDISNAGRGFQLSYITKCTHNITEFQGVIESMNYEESFYSKRINCMWTIRAPRGNKIILSIYSMHLGDRNASVFIIDSGLKNKTLSINRVQDYQSVGDIITIKHNNSGVSFAMDYKIVGCVYLLKGKEGNLSSPNYPRTYENNQECFWEIEASKDKTIQLTIHEMVIEESPNCTKDYLQISHQRSSNSSKERHCGSGTEVVLSSLGSHLYIHFKSDSQTNDKGFYATYVIVDTVCGGLIKAKHGVISSPQYPKNYPKNLFCEWTITVSPHHRMELEMIELDIESSFECDMDYIEVFEENDDPDELDMRSIFKLCGNILEQSKWTTEKASTVQVRFESDNSIESKGFKLSFNQICGKDYIIDDYGSIEYSEPMSNQTCVYRFIAKNPAERITLGLTHVHLSATSNLYYNSEESCSQNGVKIYNGFDVKNGTIDAKFCKVHPPTIYSNGHVLTMTIPSAVVTELEGYFGILDSFCGGEYNGLNGKFSSPYYPSSYPENMDCEWVLVATSGNSMTLTIESLDIEESVDCNKDYLEVRSNNARGKLLGVFCGKEVPPSLTATEIWIKFSTSGGKGTGFLASYSYALHTELNGTSGIISSPRYPTKFESRIPYSWRITVERGYLIILHSNHLTDVGMSGMKIYDGYSDIGLTIDISNDHITYSSTNILFITARRGPFELEWESVPKLALKDNITAKAMLEKCGETDYIINAPIVFNSPGYPKGYDRDLACIWKFLPANKADHVTVKFMNLDLEAYDECGPDYVELYSSNDLEIWHLLDTVCTMNNEINKKQYDGTPNLQMKLITDYSVNKTGFSAYIKTTCGSYLTESSGYFNITNLKINHVPTECVWQIRVRQGKRIRLSLLTTKLNSCRNYFIVRNGISVDSPFLGQGKFCNDDKLEVLETSSNNAYIKFAVGTILRSPTVFYYEEISSDCSGEIQLTNELSFRTISSPNYPNLPNPHTECVWIVKAPPEHTIAINFVSKFDLGSDTSCTKEYIELYDGGTELMPIIGRYCGTVKPDVSISTRNVLRIKYMTDVTEPHIGFNLNVTIAICGGYYYTNENTINAPSHLGVVSNKSEYDCIWTIELQRGLTINLTIDNVNLEQNNCENATHLELKEIDTTDVTNEQVTDVLNLCGSYTKPKIYLVESNKLIITYKIRNKDLSKYGFTIHYKAIEMQCGETLRTGLGILQTPGYPDGVKTYTRCLWKLIVPKGRRIKLEILDFNSGSYISRFRNNHTSVYQSRLNLYNDLKMQSKIARVVNDSQHFFYSSDNTMAIEAIILSWQKYRGFKLRFSSSESTLMCQNRLNFHEDSNYARELEFNLKDRHVYCSYDLNVPDNRTLVLKMKKFHLRTNFTSPLLCIYNRGVRFEHNEEEIMKSLFCQNSEIPTLRLPFSNVVMNVYGDKFDELTLNYQLNQCGGKFTVFDEITFKHPNMTDFRGNLECAWAIWSFEYERSNDYTLNEVTQFEVTLQTTFKDSCEKEYLLLYKGPTQDFPLLGRYCGESNKGNLLIETGVFFEYITENYDATSNFSVTVVEGGGCGGTLNYPFRKIIFGSQYRNNIECIWNVVTETGYHINIEFMNRFFIESSPNCSKDYLLVEEKSVSGGWNMLAKLCGRDPPEYLNSTATEVRLIFRSDSENVGDGFTAYFERDCGSILYATKNIQHIYSPNYPYYYDENLNCNYTILPGDEHNKELILNLVDFRLETELGRRCIADNVTITTLKDSVQNEKVLCGVKSKRSFISTDSIEIIFHTDYLLGAEGFHFEYSLFSCGGNITQNSIIETPKNENNEMPTNTQCYWNITAPSTDKILIKIEKLQIELDNECTYDGVEIFRGPAPLQNASMYKLCGNLSETLPVISIPTNQALIYAYSGEYGATEGAKLAVFFAPNCDRNIFLDLYNSTYDLNIMDNILNTSHMDCDFIFKTRRGQQIQIEFYYFNLFNEDNCERDVLQLRDGAGPFAEEIGRFCGNNTPPILMSSQNALYMHLSLKPNNTFGFKAHVKSVPTICGDSYLFLNSTKPLIIKSPTNNEGTYPNNLNCYWRVHSDKNLRVRFVKINIDTGNQTHGMRCDGDYLKLFRSIDDIKSEDEFTHNRIFNGNNKKMDSSFHALEHIYCGETLPDMLIVNDNNIGIKFTTDAQIAKSGFELEISTINNCMMNYTGLQGHTALGNIREKCNVYIHAPKNYTLSIYFDSLNFYSENCKVEYIEVFDMHTNQTVQKICSFNKLSAVFTSTNDLRLEIQLQETHSSLALTYLASAFGPGCGGDLYNTAGIITSPNYPNNVRNNSDCRWSIRVPSNNHVLLIFEDFEFGTKATCHSDYLQIIEYDESTGNAQIERQFCGEDHPKVYKSTKNYLTIRLHQTVNYDGTGFLIKYKAVYENYHIPNYYFE